MLDTMLKTKVEEQYKSIVNLPMSNLKAVQYLQALSLKAPWAFKYVIVDTVEEITP